MRNAEQIDESTAEPAVAGRRYRGETPEQRRAVRRRKLLDAGAELFGTVGFAAVSIQLLCTRAGVTARHFYEEFSGLDAVLETVHDEIIADVMGKVADAITQAGTVDATIGAQTAVRTFYEAMLADPRRARIAIIEVLDLPASKALGCVDGFVAIVDGYATQLREAGLIDETANLLSSVSLVGVIRQLLIHRLTVDRSVSIDELVELTDRHFLAIWIAP